MNGTEIPLRRKEFDLLAFLYVNRGKACSKNEIAEGVWVEEGGIVSQETIDTDVFRIRQRIEPDPSHPRHVVTLPSYGYRLDM
jgi:DNA-binding response OmpR family regulator